MFSEFHFLENRHSLTLADTLPALGDKRRKMRREKSETVNVGSIVVKTYTRTHATTTGWSTGGTCRIWEVADYSAGRRRLPIYPVK